jgi:hypothetical protein
LSGLSWWDVEEDAALGRFSEEALIGCVYEDDHGAGRFMDDFLDPAGGVFGALPDPTGAVVRFVRLLPR